MPETEQPRAPTTVPLWTTQTPPKQLDRAPPSPEESLREPRPDKYRARQILQAAPTDVVIK